MQNSKKKKIAIITTHHEPNFGNKLQNYALQLVLTRMGFDVEVINDARSWPDLISFWAQKKNILHALIPWRQKKSHVKYSKFFFWSLRHIHYSKVNLHSDKDMIGLENKYDYFVVGSDQIWNPEVPIFSNNFGFATFAREQQKIAYAPSLAVSNLPNDRKKEYESWLSGWKALSCREDDGAKIISEITKRDIPVVVDPTLLLTAEDWEKLSTHKVKVTHYLIVYTIGEMQDEYVQYINTKAANSHLSIINLNKGGNYEGCGPSEFIDIIKHAELIITDSFHGSVFALLFHIPIVILQRIDKDQSDQFSRIRTLFRHANIQPRDFTKPINEYTSLNWPNVDKSISESRQKSITYLSKALDL